MPSPLSRPQTSAVPLGRCKERDLAATRRSVVEPCHSSTPGPLPLLTCQPRPAGARSSALDRVAVWARSELRSLGAPPPTQRSAERSGTADQVAGGVGLGRRNGPDGPSGGHSPLCGRRGSDSQSGDGLVGVERVRVLGPAVAVLGMAGQSSAHRPTAGGSGPLGTRAPDAASPGRKSGWIMAVLRAAPDVPAIG